MSLGRAHVLASRVIDALWRATAGAHTITPVGALRRSEAEIDDIPLLAALDEGDGQDLLDAASRLSFVDRVVSRSPGQIALVVDDTPVTIHLVAAEAAGGALLALTGSAAFVAAVGAVAREHALALDGWHLLDASGRPMPCPSEEELYDRLGMAVVPPELRDGAEAVPLARQRRLPALLSDLHIRGDLHMHTTWSDGRDSLTDMVRAAKAIGYEYVAITDHSQSAASSRKLALEDVQRQRTEVVRAARANPEIEVLHGIEVEILPDGSLDFDDGVLEGFDIVLASLHDAAGQTPSALTARCLQAMENPFVNVLTHPANRVPALSPGYDLDFDALFRAAAASGTALEVDGAPGHLDMDGALARRAIGQGATLVVSSDGHRGDVLGRQMRFAVATARRGWVEPRHVLNARPLAQVRAFVAAKRDRVRSRT